MAKFWLAVSSVLAAGAHLASSTSHNFDKRFTTYDGNTYAYDYVPAQNDQPTVLLLHGYPASRNDWRYQVADLTAAGFGVIAPDCLGYGDSDRPIDLEAYNFKRMSGHFDELLEHENLETVVGVGHDWGSILLSRVVTWHPERFHKLAFLSAAYSPPGLFLDIDRLNAQGLEQLGYMNLGYWYFLNSYTAGPLIAEKLESYFHLVFAANNSAWGEDLAGLGAARAWLTATKLTEIPSYLTEEDKATWLSISGKENATEAPLNYYRSIMRGTQMPDEQVLTNEQRTLKVPVLGLCGVEDLVTRSDQLGAQIKPWASNGYTEKAVEGAGHWLMLDKREEVSGYLVDFAGED